MKTYQILLCVLSALSASHCRITQPIVSQSHKSEPSPYSYVEVVDKSHKGGFGYKVELKGDDQPKYSYFKKETNYPASNTLQVNSAIPQLQDYKSLSQQVQHIVAGNQQFLTPETHQFPHKYGVALKPQGHYKFGGDSFGPQVHIESTAGKIIRNQYETNFEPQIKSQYVVKSTSKPVHHGVKYIQAPTAKPEYYPVKHYQVTSQPSVQYIPQQFHQTVSKEQQYKPEFNYPTHSTQQYIPQYVPVQPQYKPESSPAHFQEPQQLSLALSEHQLADLRQQALSQVAQSGFEAYNKLPAHQKEILNKQVAGFGYSQGQNAPSSYVQSTVKYQVPETIQSDAANQNAEHGGYNLDVAQHGYSGQSFALDSTANYGLNSNNPHGNGVGNIQYVYANGYGNEAGLQYSHLSSIPQAGHHGGYTPVGNTGFQPSADQAHSYYNLRRSFKNSNQDLAAVESRSKSRKYAPAY